MATYESQGLIQTPSQQYVAFGNLLTNIQVSRHFTAASAHRNLYVYSRLYTAYSLGYPVFNHFFFFFWFGKPQARWGGQRWEWKRAEQTESAMWVGLVSSGSLRA